MTEREEKGKHLAAWQHERSRETPLSVQRLTALSDGIFAFAMTVLVIDVRFPALPFAITFAEVIALWPKVISCILSFAILGVYWIAHHNTFAVLKRSNRVFIWINILFLMCIAFLPFASATLGQHGPGQVALIIYGVILIITSAVLQLLYWYASSRRLVDVGLDSSLVTKRVILPALICLFAIGVSAFAPLLSLVLYILVPIIYIWPSRVDQYWTPSPKPPPESHPSTPTQ